MSHSRSGDRHFNRYEPFIDVPRHHASSDIKNYSPAEILTRYHIGKFTINQAIDALERNSTSIALLWAGELDIEYAQTQTNVEVIAETLGCARDNFQNSKTRQLGRTLGKFDHVLARSKIHEINLPVYGGMLIGNSLPSLPVANKIYGKTVEVGLELSKHYESLTNSDSSYTRISGLLGRVAILALIQRDVINGQRSQVKFPLLSTVSAHSIFEDESNIAKVWDIDIFTSKPPAEQNDTQKNLIQRSLKLKVHTVPNKMLEKFTVDQNMATVIISPGLRISGVDNHNISSEIIRDCHRELSDPSETQATTRLNFRDQLLHEIIAA